ncbi:MAG: family 1 glycosylhydrolase [bacterium]|nr:family 1 glycosylhydrolase [bacterium]
MNIYKFPENFKWGSATSAHQVEGDNHNDWSEWEVSKPRVESLKSKGLNPEDFISGKACDSYNRYQEDFDIAKKLNQNIHRFSIEWSRIEPEEGRFNEKEMQHYIDVVKALRDRGIEPMITLWHFTNPIWFAEKGGFLNIDSPKYFTRYVKYVADNLKDQVGLWITFNEALTVYAGFTKLNATWPSRGRGILNFVRTRRNIVKAHVLAYREIKKIYDQSPSADLKSFEVSEVRPQPKDEVVSHNVMVGITENNVYVPDSRDFLATRWRRLYKKLRNFYFFKQNIPYYDFIGLNYYHMSRKPAFNLKHEIIPKQEINENMKWELYPEGLYHVLKDLKKFNKPIFITENGIPDSTDKKREKFIKDHLYWVHKAIQDGVDVRGYLYWSLLDNFEWHLGYSPRFGLVEVDFSTFERRIRPSALEYAKICKENALNL